MSAMAQNSERINFRLEPKAKQQIEQAALVKGLTLTQFMLTTLLREAHEVLKSSTTLLREAHEVLKSSHVLVLSDRDRDTFLAALDNPPAPSSKLLKAAKAYKAATANGRLRST